MPELSISQEELRQSIQKSAVTWAVVLAVVAALIAYWIMGGQQATIRLGAAGVLGLGAGFGVYRWIFNSRARSARCEKCSAAFSISRSDRAETQISSDAKEKRERQDDGSVKISRWIEEKFDVVDTYTCANCDNVTTKQHQTTRRRDEESIVEAPHGKGAKLSSKSASSRPASGKSSAPRGSQAGAAKEGSSPETSSPASTARPAPRQKGAGRGKSGS